MYLEHLKNSSNDENIFIETIVKGSGPFLTKIMQRFGNLETIQDIYRNKILKCYEELPKMSDFDIEVMKDFLTSKKQLLDDKEKNQIRQFNFSEPISIASIGQVHKTTDGRSPSERSDGKEPSTIDESAILKFIKPRTIVYLLIEVLMIKKISEESLKIDNIELAESTDHRREPLEVKEDKSLNKKIKDFLYFFAIYVMTEFNFKKEKNNLLKCKDTYKYYENNILKIKCAEILEKEPFSLGGIPYFWMKVSEGETLNKILERKDKNKCKKIIPQMMKLLKIWLISSLFQESEFHVDLHPGNIIVDNDGNITLIDFGNCCLLNNEDRSALIKCIEWHEKVVKMVNRLIYKGNNNYYSKLNIFNTIKLGEINQGEILFYVNKIILELTKIMKIKMLKEDFNELVYKTSTEFYMKDSYRTLFGAMTEYMINNTNDIGIFSRSKVLEFSKGIITLDKTWMQICLLCDDENLNKDAVHVGFDQLSLFEKLQLYKKIQQYK
jgi:serine/threonine protein kinase